MHDIRAIANEIIKVSNEKGIKITPIKLQKLVFLVYGWGVIHFK